ncbi:hypothetical protein PPL_11677 [Heterostelium album PN500]|uniref:Uncharacterized protein n=1 Tax=Heterostelium pallidum (strain ATCC 26659 / Pp 5 / PN500) TaxID=670386 RepID=D3BU58_HETP5|nr:hypothetical protein PPL_11677 [Heterostelium album PN500]EFA75059.1 hypothetical protein PPL_11677 [Heterostelium album PN500]|eukprot:XP_020427193.1 hypothetical protein PPL_11677 [Heterostelium album PN500]
MVRIDKRNNNQIRSIESELALLNKADGSAKFSLDNSSVLAAIYGPVEVNPRKEKISKATVEVVFTPDSGNQNYQTKEQESLIRNAIESVIMTMLHPRTLISIIIQVYSTDGSIVSCSINAACLALLDAGIELNSLIASISLSFNSDGQIYLDPTMKEENESKATAIYAFNSQLKLMMIKSSGIITEQQNQEALQLARSSCERILAYIRTAVKTRIMGDTESQTKDTVMSDSTK